MTATLSGPRYRAFIYDIHQQMGCLLEASTAAHLSEEEASNCNITQLPPLSWEKDSTDESGTLFSQPLSTENFDEMIKQRNIGRKAEWKAMVKRRDMRCGLPKTHCHPWSAARTRNISHAQGRRKVGEEMVRLFREQLKTTWFGSQNLTSSGGWRTLSSSEQDQYRGWIDTKNPTFTILAIMHPSDHYYGKDRAWCAVADGNLEAKTEPDDEQLLRSELVAALRIARNRIKRDKSYRSAIYPITVLSISMLYARILQIHVDPARRALVVRKTPYIHLDRRSGDSVKMVLQWHVGHQVGDTTREHASGPATLSVTAEEGDDSALVHTQVPRIVITSAQTEQN